MKTNVLYCGDRGITDGLILSILSLLKHNKQTLNIYVFTAKCNHMEKCYLPLSEMTISALDACAKETNPCNCVKLMDITELFDKTPLSANSGTRFTPLCMLRLFADKVDGIPDKLLYLDCDVVCKKNISELYETNVDNYEFAGVLDRYGKWFFKKNLFRFDYVNSGVLLLNMSVIKETGLFEKCRTRCANKKMLMPDQSALNKLAKNKLLLPNVYNNQKSDTEDTVLRHFSNFFKFFPKFQSVSVKPWQTERLHTVLKTREYDELNHELSRFKKLYHI